MTMQADFVIVGAGSAGSAMAARLSEDGKHSVIVIEHGGSDFGPWSQGFAKAIQKIITWQPQALVIALGVDAHEAETLCDFRLQTDDFKRIGQTIGRLGLKTVFVMEGGYAHDVIGFNVAAVLGGYLSEIKK